MSGKLLKNTATVSSMTFMSRILGLIRDMVFLRLFGAAAGMDAFFVAFRIPNFLRRLFAEGAFSLAFVPVLSEYKTQRGDEEVRQLVSRVAGTLGGILFIVTLIGVIAAPIMVAVFAPGFLMDTADAEKAALTEQMLRITFPYLLFISLVAMAGGVLNSYGRFGVPAFTPVIMNLCLIGAALWLAPYFEKPVVGLAWGVFISGVAQLLFQLPFLHRLGLLTMPRWGNKDEGVRRIMRLMIPAIFGSSVAQINLLIDTLIASFLITGSVTWLYASDRLVEFPLGVFGIALATVILPSLSQRHAEDSPEAFSHTLDWALRLVLFIGTPATLGLFILSGPILSTLFEYGEFSARDVLMSSYSLMAYATGLLGFIGIKVLAQGFYARQDTRTPVRIGIVAMVSNMILNVIFVYGLKFSEFGALHMGLALATSASAFINAGMLFMMLRRQGIYTPDRGWGKAFLRVTVASVLMVGFLLWAIQDLSVWSARHWVERVGYLILWVVLAKLIYFIALRLQGVKITDFISKKAGS